MHFLLSQVPPPPRCSLLPTSERSFAVSPQTEIQHQELHLQRAPPSKSSSPLHRHFAILRAVRLAARPRASPSLFALSSPLAPRRLTFSKTDRLLEYQKWYMSLPSTADASAVNETLWPPRDKQARRLWHELQRFKKQQMGGAKSHILDLPPQSSYLRACTHHYAKLLGLATETQASGNGRAVRVTFDAATAGSALGELEFSAATLRKRKEPPDAQPDDNADDDGEKADGASPRPEDGSSGGAGTSGGAGVSGGEGAPASSSDASDAALERHRLKKAFTSRISKCVKTNDTAAATAAWRELVASGIAPPTDVCSTLLHIYASAPQPLLAEALEVFVAAQKQAAPAEPMWSGIIKLHCAAGDPTAGLARIEEMIAAGVAPRLRSFSPIISAACEARDHELAERCVELVEARATEYNLALSPSEHVELLRLALYRAAATAAATAATAATAASSRAAAPATQATFDVNGGGAPAGVLEAALRRMMVDAPQLAPSHVERVLESFREYGPQARWVAVPCATDARGECSYSGVTLAPALIDESERAELRRLIPQLVGARIKATEFAKFAQWIERELVRAGPFDYVLDGANIGFFGCSKVEKARRLAKAASAVVSAGAHPPSTEATAEATAEAHASSGGGKGGGRGGGKGGGRFEGKGGGGAGAGAHTGSTLNHHQIDWLLEHVRRASPDARVLLVLHTSHTAADSLAPAAAAIVHRWRAEGVLFETPAGMNDDWYWLHAAVASGPGCKVVSNDEMRDHTFGLMDSRVFAKWRERHVVHFDIPGGTTAAAAGLKPALLPPLPYSHVMQEHPSGCWHVPCAEQHPNGWVCVQRREDLL